jgi:cleavage stimulation factor subunit 1
MLLFTIKYCLLIDYSQLKSDGFIGAANAVAEATMTFPPSENTTPDRLSDLVLSGLQSEKQRAKDLRIPESTKYSADDDGDETMSTLDDERNLTFETRFITTHKGPCRCAKFTRDGKFVVTGSGDCSLKVCYCIALYLIMSLIQ